jgi:gamma-glutamylcyclotransferase (GGCT)/AIG2-like uncharacterized protein YtfP
MPKMLSENLFVYGTLKNPKIQKKAFGRVAKGKPDILFGYKKAPIKIEGENHSVIIPDAKSNVKGLILNVNLKELKLIDEYEANNYKRSGVILESGEKAWVYVEN